MIKITSHVLDTSKGKPAEGITLVLYQGGNDEWKEMSRSVTNADGRTPSPVNGEQSLQEGIYKIRFETKDYFDKNNISTFYPFIEIIFEIKDAEHYHIPLLLSPYGYSTYRGS
jgi:5-hydroxyisourate hydrolase